MEPIESTNQSSEGGRERVPEGSDDDSLSLIERLNLKPGPNLHVTIDRRRYGIYSEGNIHADNVAGHDALIQSRLIDESTGLAVRFSPISEARLNKLIKVTIRSGDYARYKRVLDDHRLLILYGPRGAGKGAAAVDLLGQKSSIVEIDPLITPTQLSAIDFHCDDPAGSAYIVDNLTGSTAQNLSAFAVRDLSRKLSAVNASLVITIDDRAKLDRELEVSEYVVKFVGHPPPEEMLRQHLLFYHEGEVDAVDRLISAYGVDEVRALCQGRNAASLDALAAALTDGHAVGLSLPDALLQKGLNADEQIQNWFQEDHDVSALALILAVAVLDGCSYQTLARHSARLQGLLMAKIGKEPVLDQSVLTRSRTERLREVMAHTTHDYQHTEFGITPVDAVSFDYDWLAEGVLTAVWREYDILAESLLQWIRAVSDDSDVNVRLRAAWAVGNLARLNFASIRQQVLLPWISSGTRRSARCAAEALGVAAGDDNLAISVLSLLRHWATVNNPNLNWTAVVAYGTNVGLKFLDEAMEALKQIGCRQPSPLIEEVHESLHLLFFSLGAFDPGVAADFLENLHGWSTAAAEPRLLALRQFAYLLGIASEAQSPLGREAWTLLCRDEVIVRVAGLTRLCLAERETRAQTLQSLRRIVDMTESDAGTMTSVQQILKYVATGPGAAPRDRERLLHYLGNWAVQGSKSNVAARFLTEITEAP
jgi:hypothetical protein